MNKVTFVPKAIRNPNGAKSIQVKYERKIYLQSKFYSNRKSKIRKYSVRKILRQ